MLTFDEKHLWVFPLAPTAFDCAILIEYFGKFRGAKIEVPQAQVDFGGNLSVREVIRPNQRMQSNMGVPKRRFQICGEWRRNTILRCVNTITGCSLGRSNTGNCSKLKTLQFRAKPGKLAMWKGKQREQEERGQF